MTDPSTASTERRLGLPPHIRLCLFDLDGVLTDTASVHRAAWGAAFDPVLKAHGQPEFTDQDYDEYVDGKPRLDGVRDFINSRHIDLPEGKDDDGPDADTMHGIAARKNDDVLARIHRDGVKVFEGSRRYLEAARQNGLRRVVVSSSANTVDVLKVTGLDVFIEGEIDGNTIIARHLHGKPAPDSFLAGAELLGIDPADAVVFEDATAGVEAGHRGAFGYVVGVNRQDQAHGEDLAKHGASVVVTDLGELL
ncbi:beta-phosphoglucomutase family hydrolase [Jatrophihabitans sp.]|uniref:beta-phosphoglucomutase family hydrolase n=1 Tax=Jatrophihabitans sp. TaxID=1932789 RepID=UPI0030C73DBC|nr:beta-phosphoglucomutase family hydrolase [Jatrophihabitans sp.]